VVSRGGRPDLAGAALPGVRCPTLLIVGERDEPVIELNEQARRAMKADVKLVIVPHATHLFEEPGALEQVAALAREWFTTHLPAATGTRH
jgi:putative phosphoribosyl transferase